MENKAENKTFSCVYKYTKGLTADFGTIDSEGTDKMDAMCKAMLALRKDEKYKGYYLEITGAHEKK